MAVALLPLKNLAQAKTRLAGSMTSSERKALAQAMAEDVLVQLANHPCFERVVLVSDDLEARHLATRYDVELWSEDSLGCRGLNNVLEAAAARLNSPLYAGAGTCRPEICVLHGDVPLLQAHDLDAVFGAASAGADVVLATDSAGRGTNLLFLNGKSLPFQFGRNSRVLHERSAFEHGLGICVLQRPGLALDIDAIEDMRVLLDLLPADSNSFTANYLRSSGLRERLELIFANESDEERTVRQSAAELIDRRRAI